MVLMDIQVRMPKDKSILFYILEKRGQKYL